MGFRSQTPSHSPLTGGGLFWKGIFFSLCFLLTACSTLHHHPYKDGKPADFKSFKADNIPDAVPQIEPRSHYGNPPSYVAMGQRYYVRPSAEGWTETGIASWYGTKFHSMRTSSGEKYDMYKMTAAHKTLPIPCYVRVTNLETGKNIIVRVNDRGPFAPNRIIDLSFVAAKKLGVTEHGTAYVRITTLDPLALSQSVGTTSPLKPHRPVVYLQLGAFHQKDKAEALARRIERSAHRQVEVLEKTVRSQLIYKIQVGPIVGVPEVDRLTRAFKKEGYGDAYVVVR